MSLLGLFIVLTFVGIFLLILFKKVRGVAGGAVGGLIVFVLLIIEDLWLGSSLLNLYQLLRSINFGAILIILGILITTGVFEKAAYFSGLALKR